MNIAIQCLVTYPLQTIFISSTQLISLGGARKNNTFHDSILKSVLVVVGRLAAVLLPTISDAARIDVYSVLHVCCRRKFAVPLTPASLLFHLKLP